ncbi:MAG: DNA mismatch repair protein MutS [Myxococcales bacterium]|nr:DNA mismatch repair protein MutS [Myxococcales bacterium]
MSSSKVREQHEARLAALLEEKTALERRDLVLSRLRGATFLVTAALTLVGLFRPSASVWLGAGACFTVFATFVVRHATVATAQFECERRIAVVRHAIARILGTFRFSQGEARRRGDGRGEAHAYAADLDLFGESSLYEQLNLAHTPDGQERLASYLTNRASVTEIAERQGAAKELATLARFREDLAVEGRRAEKPLADSSVVVAWASSSEPVTSWSAVVPIALLVLTQLGAALLVARAGEHPQALKLWGALVVAQLIVGVSSRARTESVLEPVTRRGATLGPYARLFALLEGARFTDARLAKLRERVSGDGATAPASLELERLDRLVGFASVRHNGVVSFLLNVAFLWDYWCACGLSRWRRRAGHRVRDWLGALGELEALSSIGTFAGEHPEFAWPIVTADEDGPRFCATELAHPLILPALRVPNDVALGGPDATPRALLITGSNMSGKSTFLRAVGTSAVLAQAGAPVCASALTMTPLAVCTSIRVDDSLAEGASRFYAEVRKLKLVLDAARAADPPVLFLLDEVLHGTNSRERVIGAKAVVLHLVQERGLGVVTSHDLGLVELEELSGKSIQNRHFEDHLEEGRLAFDYRMKDGPVLTSNALRLMREVGIDVVEIPAS